MPLEKRVLRSLDGWLILVTLALSAFGLLAVFSATHNLLPNGSPFYFVQRQAVWLLVGALSLVALLSFDYRYFRRFSRLLYLGSLTVLLLVAISGHMAGGAQRWLSLGPIPIQPSEFVKVALIITLAKHLEQKESLNNWLDLVSPFVHMGIPMILVLLQPDLGSTIIYACITFGMLFVAGAKPRQLLVLMAGGLGVGVVAAFTSLQGWIPLLKEYQVRRLLVFLDPYQYALAEGWNVIQSMIAIGSGQFFGKGLFSGSQTQLSFLPSRHTDFIFSVIGEEMGFLGAVSVLALYFIFLWRTVRTIGQVDNRFGQLLVAGVFSMFLAHVVINVGMTLSIMPVTGKTLPFFSYGGSSALSAFVALGILFNVNMHRRKIHF